MPVPPDGLHQVFLRINDLWQSLGIGQTALSEAGYRRGHADGFMRPLVVVDHSPAVEFVLDLLKVKEVTPVQHICLERAMETFVLAIGLWMSRTTVTDANAQLNQPDGELGNAVFVLRLYRERRMASPDRKQEA